MEVGGIYKGNTYPVNKAFRVLEKEQTEEGFRYYIQYLSNSACVYRYTNSKTITNYKPVGRWK